MLKRYVAFDLETTGLSPEKNEIIEIGALKVENGKVAERFSTFVQPGETLSATITALTGITPAMLIDAPRPEQVIPSFVDFCEDCVCVGHNLMFDYRFTHRAAMKLGLEFNHQGLDTLAIARSVLPDLESKSLGALCEHYKIINEAAHRAYHDALATAKLYQILAHGYEDGFPDIFLPKELYFKEKKQQQATKKQMLYLKELYKYHRIEDNGLPEHMTRSEASRKIDQIILEKGRMEGYRPGGGQK